MKQKRQGSDKSGQNRKFERGEMDKDTMKEKRRGGGQPQAEDKGSEQQQGDWGPEQDKEQQGGMGRKPGPERDRDYDPDGDRVGR